jgi:hypothetical protein
MSFESNILLIILQTYSKKIDTTGIEIILVLIIIIIWFLMTGGKKVNKSNNYKSSVVLNPTKNNNIKNDNSFQQRMILLNVDELYKSIDYSYNQYNDVSKEEYDILLSYKNILIQNVNYVELIKPKVNSLYQTYVTPEYMRMIYSFDIFGRNYIFGNQEFLSPFQNKVQIEFEKCNFSLFGKKLKFITTNQYPVLINDDGFIYLYNLSDKFFNDMVYFGDLTFPIEYLDHLDYDLSNSKFDLSINTDYLREVLKRMTDKELFLSYLNKLILFVNNKTKSKKITDKFFYNTIKENYKLKISELIEILYESNSLSLNEYLINVELGRLEFNIDYILNIIFETKYIGSFYSKKRSELKITETSKKLLSIYELKMFYKNNYTTKESFYQRFNLCEYLNNINLDSLKQIDNYKKTFNYFEFNRIVDKENRFNFPETSIPYFGGVSSEKQIFLKNSIFNFEEKDNLTNLIEFELRKVENEIRVLKGYKIVGSYTNESILFVKLKEHFSNYKVISQGRPEWLGRQSLDIYFPDYNIGIEYQGEQHFRPIDFFGGIDKFDKQVKLDDKKRQLCKENNCILIEVKEGYNFEDLLQKIQIEIGLR